MLLDAGGGTVDANTYQVSETTPLRLTREVVHPGGEQRLTVLTRGPGTHGKQVAYLDRAF